VEFAAEAQLQKLLYDSPELIPTSYEEDQPAVFIREAGLPGSGYTDLLGVDERGNILVVETKLARNDEVRRKVIGQVLVQWPRSRRCVSSRQQHRVCRLLCGEWWGCEPWRGHEVFCSRAVPSPDCFSPGIRGLRQLACIHARFHAAELGVVFARKAGIIEQCGTAAKALNAIDVATCLLFYKERMMGLHRKCEREMVALKHSRDRLSFATRVRIAFVFLAILSLTVSLATRYTNQQLDLLSVTAVKSESLEANRQHLLGDGLEFTAPVTQFFLFQPPRSAVFAISAFVPSTNLESESWLYNRPPPAC
jgi:hypothetical protein